MMNLDVMQAADLNDAALVQASLGGNREAFGVIVQRYQNLLCSLAFEALGCVAWSEDAAQEAFVEAWTHLRSLREPEKLRAWLCGILRHRVHRHRREQKREPADMSQIDEAVELPSLESLPSEEAISREEEAILWRSLEKMPALYRQPLVLFYRQQQSVAQVAAQLELSQDAVKQRLARGRQMLGEQVQEFVEGALRRSAPGMAFAGKTLAALPLVTPGATAGAGLAAKSGFAAKFGSLALAAAPFIGIFSGFAAQWTALNSGSSAGERSARRVELVRVWILVLAFAIGGNALVSYVSHRAGWNMRVSFAAQAGFWWFYAMMIATGIVRVFRQLHEPATGVHQPRSLAVPMNPGTLAAVVLGTHLMVFSSIITVAARTRDLTGLAAIVGLMLALCVGHYNWLRGKTGVAASRASVAELGVICAAMITVLNFRIDVWAAAYTALPFAEIHQRLPLWLVPALSLVLAGWTAALLAMTRDGRCNHTSAVKTCDN